MHLVYTITRPASTAVAVALVHPTTGRETRTFDRKADVRAAR